MPTKLTGARLIKALSIVDSPAFRELGAYFALRGSKYKDSDIPHRTKFTASVETRSKKIKAILDKELKVCASRSSSGHVADGRLGCSWKSQPDL